MSQSSSRAAAAVHLVATVFGLYMCYIAYGIVQEKIQLSVYGPNGEKFHNPALMIFVQVFLNCIMGFFSIKMSGAEVVGKLPVFSFIPMSLSYVLAMYTSNKALDFIDFPAQVVAKSVKMIPVMLGGVIFLGKRHPINEYIEVIVITIGITFFFLKKLPESSSASSDDAGFDIVYAKGIALSLLSLLCDGCTSTLQEKVRNKHKPTGPQFMFYMNLWSFFALIPPLVMSGGLVEGFTFLYDFPEAAFDVVLFGALSACGQLFIFSVLSNYGPLVLTMSTTTRKFFSILLSVIWFGHPLTNLQWIGAALVFGGLICHTLGKWHKADTKKQDRKGGKAKKH